MKFEELLEEVAAWPVFEPACCSQVTAIRPTSDANSRAGLLATTIIRRHVLLNLQHHDRASLLAGKLHAILQRHGRRAVTCSTSSGT